MEDSKRGGTKKTAAKKPAKPTMKKVLLHVEQVVENALPESDGMADKVRDAMVYAVSAGGKRVRPTLMYLTYKSFSSLVSDEILREKHDKAIEYFMAALEMIHTYSLIHDDLPALDNDSMRRGKPTVHKAFGEDIAILAGDGLLNYAFEVAAKSFIESPGDSDLEKAMLILAAKPGLYGMLGGQTVDVVLTGKKPSKKELSYIYSNKTAALLECAVAIGATLAGISGDDLDKLQNAAYYVGMAFQVQDDILDVVGDKDVLGKDVSQDEKNGKVTFVTIYGLDKAREYVRQASELAISLIDEAYASVMKTAENDYLKLLKDMIIKLITREK
ncbi:geranylgeranyl diphosphate synthase, type II [Eubacterium ruminantium]|nr:geranylgeranyl diphosphate synthase, type II [Eubacterium ruminantium]